MPSVLIRGGRVVDPSQNLDRVLNLSLRDGRVAAYEGSEGDHDVVVEASGRIVSPGLVDMHVHLREPGREEDETIQSGTAAALAGGFTSVVCMPDTEPPIDSAASVEFIKLLAERAGNCNVFVAACASQNREGKQLAEMGQLSAAGAVAFTDECAPIYDPELMRRALEYAQMFDRPILSHAEVPQLSQGGVMHEGMMSMLLGLPTMPAAAEEVMVGRDIVLSEATQGRVHILHISTAGGLEIIRRAKKRGTRVTCEVCPHHFVLTDECLRTFDSNYKVNPPLRGKKDVDACIRGLMDGTIDCIVSDHSPHTLEKKQQELDRAPFGLVGLETALPLVITQLVEPGHLDWLQALAKLTINPARILGLSRGTLAVGAIADVTVIDPVYQHTVRVDQFRSLSRNSPFDGWKLHGRAETVIVGGKIKYQAE